MQDDLLSYREGTEVLQQAEAALAAARGES